jgi:branched-chain amino acid aminotransferase
MLFIGKGGCLEETQFIWVNGKMVPWKEATTHVLTHTLHYGSGVFEGIRCYDTPKGPAVFRLEEHVKRLFESAKILAMDLPYSEKEIVDATKKVIEVNKVKECYVRPIAYYGYGQMGLATKGAKIDVVIAIWPWGAYLGAEGIKNGIRAKISSFARPHPNSTMIHAKITGAYFNSTLAKMEALKAGYEEAIMLDTLGNIAECSGENIFIIKDGTIMTPPLSVCLAGITRASIIQLARDKNIPIKEATITRDMLYAADECFVTGTAAEITPIREVDDRKIGVGKAGPITKSIQDDFQKIIHGKEKKYFEWLDYVKK